MRQEEAIQCMSRGRDRCDKDEARGGERKQIRYCEVIRTLAKLCALS